MYSIFCRNLVVTCMYVCTRKYINELGASDYQVFAQLKETLSPTWMNPTIQFVIAAETVCRLKTKLLKKTQCLLHAFHMNRHSIVELYECLYLMTIILVLIVVVWCKLKVCVCLSMFQSSEFLWNENTFQQQNRLSMSYYMLHNVLLHAALLPLSDGYYNTVFHSLQLHM